jgi:hypothetical protein
MAKHFASIPDLEGACITLQVAACFDFSTAGLASEALFGVIL